jgi:NADPH-dependent 2,4-dienoyl-CoA reductase/sulfur reductase-like enzyme
VHLGWEL